MLRGSAIVAWGLGISLVQEARELLPVWSQFGRLLSPRLVDCTQFSNRQNAAVMRNSVAK